MHRLTVGVVCDYLEEGWTSMDLVADMLLDSLARHPSGEVEAKAVRPPMPARMRALPVGGDSRFARTADRVLARFVDYPRRLAALSPRPTLFHIVDHSYAHLVHALPSDRTIVTCHDLDAFWSVLEPGRERRGPLFRAMARHILGGLQKAAFVTCDSHATRDGLLAYRLVAPERTSVIPLGVSPVMSPVPDGAADSRIAMLLGPIAGHPDILHVGSTIPRKRIDRLLRIIAAVRAVHPEVRLVRCGGPFTTEQAELARSLGLDGKAVVVLPFISPAELAAVYRRSAVVLQPSDAEGFGFPVVEAMACGAPVIASDLPVLREVGGDAAEYCPADDIEAWKRAVLGVLDERQTASPAWARRRSGLLAQAAKFSWSHFADRVVQVYRAVAGASDGGASPYLSSSALSPDRGIVT